MSKLIRLATPADYAFNQDIGLWELAFDKRPVKGVRCNDPVDGAYEYNQGRLKFVAALDNTKRTYSDLILRLYFNGRRSMDRLLNVSLF